MAGEQMKAETAKTAGLENTQGSSAPVILLVEDELIVREVTHEVLRHAGYTVVECSGAKEALHLADKHKGRIDLLLTDVVMPGMSGPDLAKHLQDLQPGVVTVFMSGYAESDVARRMNQFAAIHIQKPFTVDVLLSRIGEALRAKAKPGDPIRCPAFPPKEAIAAS
jgi:CheY-like chemotaxis protein